MNRFENRTAFVTGAANGIGRACMNRLAAEGAKVVAADRRQADLAGAVDELADRGHDVTGVVTDVMDEAQIEAAFREVDRVGGGRLDVSLHIAGNSMFGLIEDLATPEWERLWQLNMRSTVICCRLAIARMKTSGGGAIVNMSSISGMAGDPGWGAYNTAKAAIANLTQCLAWEVGRYNIRANAICPGPIGTQRMLGSLKSAPEQAEALQVLDAPGTYRNTRRMRRRNLLSGQRRRQFRECGATLVCDGGLTGATGQPRFDPDAYAFDGEVS